MRLGWVQAWFKQSLVIKRPAFLLFLLGMYVVLVCCIALTLTANRQHGHDPIVRDAIQKQRKQVRNDLQSDHALVFTGITSQPKSTTKNESGVELKAGSSGEDRPQHAHKPRAPVRPPKSRAIQRRPTLPRNQMQWNYLKVIGSEVTKLRVRYSTNESEAVQARRQKHMSQVCRDVFKIPPLELARTGSPFEPNMYKRVLGKTYVNDDFNLTVTIIRKVGSSNWMRFMTDLFAVSSKDFKKRWKPLRSLRERSADGIRRDLQRDTKVLFVRNPLVRLLSGFRDKYVKLPTAYNIQTANKIVQKVRGRKAKNPAIPDPTFTEFLRYLLGGSSLIRDEHFCPIFEMSKPCLLRYDFIGKLETLPSDTDYLVDKLGVRGRVEYRYPKPYSGSSNATRLVEYYAQVPPELVQKVCRVYKNDFVAFDYQMPSNFSDLKTYIEKIT